MSIIEIVESAARQFAWLVRLLWPAATDMQVAAVYLALAACCMIGLLGGWWWNRRRAKNAIAGTSVK